MMRFFDQIAAIKNFIDNVSDAHGSDGDKIFI